MFNPSRPQGRTIYQNCNVMDAQINHAPVQEEIRIYRSDFYSGILMLAKKLFML